MIKVIKKILLVLSIIFVSLSVTGCSKKLAKDDTEFVIVTTLYPTYEFVNKILEGQKDVGDNIKVILIVPYGTDSHNYDPSLSDYITICNADLFIYTSDEMEPWAKGLGLKKDKVLNLYDAMVEKYDDFKELQILQSKDLVNHEHTHNDNHNHTGDSHQHNSYKESNNLFDKLLVKLTNFISLIFPHKHSHKYDPHFWTNMKYAEYMVEVIYDALFEKISDPYDVIKKEMRLNADAYIEDLRCLYRQLKSVASQAEDKTLFFGSPFAFYYFTIRYEVDYVLTYATCSTEIDPSILVMLEVVKEMEHHNAEVILAKELTSDDAAKTIAEYAQAKVLVFHSGHNISADEAGKTSFLDIMQNNVTVFANALKVEESKIEEYNQIKGGVGNVN